MKKKRYTQKQLQNRYWWYGGSGSGILGLGLSALVESGFLKYDGADLWQWVCAGTVSLILIMTGINFLFESFRCKQELNNYD